MKKVPLVQRNENTAETHYLILTFNCIVMIVPQTACTRSAVWDQPLFLLWKGSSWRQRISSSPPRFPNFLSFSFTCVSLFSDNYTVATVFWAGPESSSLRLCCGRREILWRGLDET